MNSIPIASTTQEGQVLRIEAQPAIAEALHGHLSKVGIKTGVLGEEVLKVIIHEDGNGAQIKAVREFDAYCSQPRFTDALATWINRRG